MDEQQTANIRGILYYPSRVVNHRSVHVFPSRERNGIDVPHLSQVENACTTMGAKGSGSENTPQQGLCTVKLIT